MNLSTGRNTRFYFYFYYIAAIWWIIEFKWKHVNNSSIRVYSYSYLGYRKLKTTKKIALPTPIVRLFLWNGPLSPNMRTFSREVSSLQCYSSMLNSWYIWFMVIIRHVSPSESRTFWISFFLYVMIYASL